MPLARQNCGTLAASPGLSIAGAPVFVGEPENNGWDAPAVAGTRTVRVEVFTDDPDGFIERAVTAGADGSIDEIRDHQAPWGVHRQGGFIDPFGHLWRRGQDSPATVSRLGSRDLGFHQVLEPAEVGDDELLQLAPQQARG